MALIELREVSKIYGFGDATTVALDEVTLSIDKGEFVAIMGPSGSGKTTLMNIIGLLDHPTHGEYLLDGRKAAKLRSNQRAKARRSHIGFIFQAFNLLPRQTVIENVALPLAYKGVSTVRRLKRASAVLQKVGLKEKEFYFPKQLSGGQIQRVAIARALVTDPSIIIADEPTGNLDSDSSRRVMELLSEINAAGNTILMVTHNAELTRYASRVIYMHDGAITNDEASAIGLVPISAQKMLAPLDEWRRIDQSESNAVDSNNQSTKVSASTEVSSETETKPRAAESAKKQTTPLDQVKPIKKNFYKKRGGRKLSKKKKRSKSA